jgi:hypothetical protein
VVWAAQPYIIWILFKVKAREKFSSLRRSKNARRWKSRRAGERALRYLLDEKQVVVGVAMRGGQRYVTCCSITAILNMGCRFRNQKGNSGLGFDSSLRAPC